MPSELPPPLPGAEPPILSVPPRLTEGTGALAVPAGRLHPLTFVMLGVNAARRFAFPALIVFLTGSETSLGMILVFFLGLNLVHGIVHYFTFRYRVEAGELITSQGILERRERHIPLSRVQDLRIEQGLVHRALGVVDLRVETAGGTGAEASLSVLGRQEAEALRAAMFEAQAALRASAPVSAASAAPAEEVLRRLSLRDLVLEGLTGSRAASALVVILAAWQFVDDLLPLALREHWTNFLSRYVRHWVEDGAHPDWSALLLVLGGIALAGMLFSVVGSIILFHGFTLSRRGEDLHRAYGLFTRRSSSLPRRRIQLLRIEEPWLRRLLRLATLRADTAGSRPTDDSEGRTGRDVLLPLIPRGEVDALLPAFFPDFVPAPGRWQPVHPCAVRRGAMKGVLICVLLAAIGWLAQREVWALWPLVFVPAVYFANVLSYRHLGYVAGDRFFWTRRGWLGRKTHIVPLRNVQVAILRQNPFDRRHRVGTLQIDTAGQGALGNGPHLRNIPFAAAVGVARELARQAGRVRFRW